MNETFFHRLIETSRFLSVLYDNLPEAMKKASLYDQVQVYLEKYASSNNISPATAIDAYNRFIALFNKHCKQFVKTGTYPAQNGADPVSIRREEYDIVLLLSVLFTPHRFRIMQLISQKNLADRGLFIGLGPGLELFLTRNHFKEIHAYDLSLNDFLTSEFPGIQLNKELYAGQPKNYFDAIYMIELLEHLSDPLELIHICYGSLKQNGKIFLTTATDLPQFDHLYNFPKDHAYFEKEIIQMGFRILYKEPIAHEYLTLQIKPFNHFYTLERI
jgi:hypothetical protein